MMTDFSEIRKGLPYLTIGICLSCFCAPGTQLLTAGEPLFSTLDEHKNPHLRVGVSFRRVNVDFSVNPRARLPFGSLQNLQTGPGDVGLFTAASGNIVYQDGTVGPEVPGFPAGDAFFTANDSSQISPTVPPKSLTGIDVREVTFTSSESTVTNTVSVQGQGLRISDDETNAAPYLQLVFPIDGLDGGPWDKNPVDKGGPDNRFKNFTIGYTYLHSSHGSGPFQIGTQRFASTATTYNYTYEYWSQVATPPPGAPAADGGLIYDAASFNVSLDDFIGNIDEPRTGSTTVSNFQNLNVVSQSSLNINLHEIPIGFECGRLLGKSTVALTGGGTINIVDLGMTSWTSYFQNGNPVPVFSRVSSGSETPVKLGAYLGLNCTHPLNEDGSTYLNFHGSYRWVDSFTASTADVRADIDLSSWEGGIGIGFLLK